VLLNQEEQNRGKPNWEHLTDELHVLLTVEDTENRATLKLARAVEEVKKLLVPVVRKFQLYTLLFPLLLDDNSPVREEREERSRRETFSHKRVFFFFLSSPSFPVSNRSLENSKEIYVIARRKEIKHFQQN
jgi:hypothetical protein